MFEKHSAEEIYESAMAHLNNGDKPAAVVQLGEACLKRPTYHEAYNNRGNILLQLGNVFDALLNYDRALSIHNAPEYHNNRGAALADLGKWHDAEAAYRVAIEGNPKFEHAHTNLGNVLKLLDRLPEASDHYRLAIDANPNHVDAHLNLSFVALEMGDYKTGWDEFEWRWKSGQIPPRNLPVPEWRGEPLPDGAGLLLYGEQGLGDVLQFCRYGPEIKHRHPGVRVYVEARPALSRLLSCGLKGVDGVIAYGDKIPGDVVAGGPLMTCPRILGHGPEDCPAPRQYIWADDGRAKTFDTDFGKLPAGLKVGLCWAGMNRIGNLGAAAIDKRRSTSLAALAPMATVPGVSWVSLQKGPPADQIASPPRGMTILDCMPDCDDMADTAALISRLDLVISVDTAICHLAAALGKPTWVLSRKDSCWRWFGDRKDSPWYPTVRHFRQKTAGDWAVLAQEVALELRSWVMSRQLAAA